jgi:hypothetical protein
MRLTNAGNVGIGVNPSARLDVAGSPFGTGTLTKKGPLYEYIFYINAMDGPRTVDLFEISQDTANWGYGGVKIEIMQSYYYNEGYNLSYMYSSYNTSGIRALLGNGVNTPTLGAWTTISGTIQKATVSVVVPYYFGGVVKLEFSNGLTPVGNLSAPSQIKFLI